MIEFSEDQRTRIALIAASFSRIVGRPLVNAPLDDIQSLWGSPLAIVAHGTEPEAVFFFGNQTALEAFEMSFEAFTKMPSRLSAEPMLRGERAALLARVRAKGFIDDYAGIRISSSGKRFRIKNAVVWNLIDAKGLTCGQAAAFGNWEMLD